MQQHTPNDMNHDTTSYFGMTLSFMIIMLLVILVGLYLWGREMQNEVQPSPTVTRPSAMENNEPESTTLEAEVETLGAMSTSDELPPLESELVGTPFEEEVFDAMLDNIETEIKSAL